MSKIRDASLLAAGAILGAVGVVASGYFKSKSLKEGDEPAVLGPTTVVKLNKKGEFIGDDTVDKVDVFTINECVGTATTGNTEIRSTLSLSPSLTLLTRSCVMQYRACPKHGAGNV